MSRNKDIALELEKLLKSDVLDSDEERVVQAAIDLLKRSMVTVLTTAFKQGFVTAIQYGTRGTNVHITANRYANAYALEMIHGKAKAEEVQAEPEVRTQA